MASAAPSLTRKFWPHRRRGLSLSAAYRIQIGLRGGVWYKNQSPCTGDGRRRDAMSSENIVTLTATNFDEETRNGSRILVDFWAEWCGPGRMVAPVLEQLAKDYAGKARVGKVNVDDHSNLASRYGVMSIPTLLIFKQGKVVEQFIGSTTRDVLAKLLDKHI